MDLILTVLLLAQVLPHRAGPGAYAFLAPAGETWQVWTAEEGAPPRPITSDPADKVSLSASPLTGEMLALAENGTATILDPDGRRIGTVGLGRGVHEAALSPDGEWIVFTREEAAPPRDRHLWITDRQGHEARRLLQSPGMQHSPAWSPDGTVIAYTSSGPEGSEDLWTVRLDGSDQKQLTVASRQNLDPSIGPAGELYFTTNRSGAFDLWRLDPDSWDTRAIDRHPAMDSEPRISSDGLRLLFVSRRSGRAAIWTSASDGSEARLLGGPDTGIRHPVWLEKRRSSAPVADAAPPSEGTAGPKPHSEPAADGRPAGSAAKTTHAGIPDRGEGRIAFLRLTEGSWQPWSVRADGSGLAPLAHLPADVSRVTLSADGRSLLANAIDGRIFLVDVAKGAPRRIDIEPAGPTDAAISPDGSRIAYSVNTLGGIDSNDIWVAPSHGGRGKRLTDQPFLQHFPVWSPDGNEVLFLSGRGGQTHDLWSVQSDGASPKLVLGKHTYNFEPTVSTKGDIAFSSNEGSDYDLWILEAGATTARRLTTSPGFDGQPSFSPDGARVAFVSRRGGNAGLWIHDLATDEDRRVPVDGEVRLPFWYRGDGASSAGAAGGTGGSRAGSAASSGGGR